RRARHGVESAPVARWPVSHGPAPPPAAPRPLRRLPRQSSGVPHRFPFSRSAVQGNAPSPPAPPRPGPPARAVTKECSPMSFQSLGLAPALLRALSEQGYQTPTPIQQAAIPLVLEGHD